MPQETTMIYEYVRGRELCRLHDTLVGERLWAIIEPTKKSVFARITVRAENELRVILTADGKEHQFFYTEAPERNRLLQTIMRIMTEESTRSNVTMTFDLYRPGPSFK